MNKYLSKPYIPYAVAFLGAMGLQSIIALNTSENIRFTNSIFSFFVFVLSAGLLRRIWKEFLDEPKNSKIMAAVFAALLSIALHFGSRLEAAENVRMNNITLWVHIVFLALLLLPVITVLWSRTETVTGSLFLYRSDKGNDVKSVKFLQIWGIIFLLWIPVFLALYPGAFVYDAQEEYIEVISRTFTMHHPLLHVLILGGLVHGAEYLGYHANAGIACYVLMQMAVMSGILAYSIKKLENFGLKKTYLICVMAFYGLFPIFPMYAVCTAKDGLFTAFLCLCIIELTVYVLKVEEFNPVIFTMASVLMMLLRNNGIYAFAAAMAVIAVCEFIRCRAKNRASETEEGADSSKGAANHPKVKKTHTEIGRLYKLILLAVLSVVLYTGSNMVLKIATQASDNEHQEILTVPIQQLARAYTYSEDVFSEQDIETLHEFLPEESLITYRFRVSDVLKSGFNNPAYDRGSSSFWSLWSKIGLRKPMVYLNAWFGTSYGYWYPDALNNVYEGNQMYTFQYTESSYFGFETEPPGVRRSLFPVLERFYENLSLKQFQQRVPVISQLFSPGFMWWLLAFVLFYLLSRGKRSVRGTIPLLPALFVWLTVLLGPTTLVRYVLILWFIIPLYPVLIQKTEKTE